MEMTVSTSRIITIEQQVPQVQVNNPEVLQLTVLSPTQIQIAAKKAGVTQVNIWDEKNQIYTIDVIVFGDARELQEMLKSQFPNTSLSVTPVANSVVISGFVDKPEVVPHVIRIAEEYYPKVINNIVVGGVHQVLLHCKVMEVSRSKLRELGFDFSKLTGSNIVQSSVTGTLGSITGASMAGQKNPGTFFFQVLQGGGSAGFFGVLKALREDSLLKIMAEPTLVCYSGRPATFLVGGEFPILVPQSLGTVSIEYKEYGTQLDFVPIVLGNGRIRLEVRPRVSEIDDSRSVQLQEYEIPALKVRTVETGVELDAGQTLAIAGLVEETVEGGRRSLPWIGELPYVGMLFGGIENKINEIELLILVTPELVDAMNPDEVPQCLPGMRTDSPNDWELYAKRYIEVPRCCPPGSPGTCPDGGSCSTCNQGQVIINESVQDGSYSTSSGQLPGMILHPKPVETISKPVPHAPKASPSGGGGMLLKPTTQKSPYSAPVSRYAPGMQNIPRSQNMAVPQNTASRYTRPSNRYMPPNQNRVGTAVPNRTPSAKGDQKTLPGFIGPVGYDVVR